MGRKRKYDEVAVVVEIDGELLTWVNGSISGKKELLDDVKLFASLGKHVDITPMGPIVRAQIDNIENPMGALAALISVSPGRARILEVPQNVLDRLPVSTGIQGINNV